MNKQEFAQLFANALETAVQNGEKKLRCPLPRDHQILLYGAGCSGVLLDPASVLERLYLGEDKFYRIIDVAVVKASKQFVTVFVRASGHKPAPFAQTWNNPPGNGPFKQLLAKNIEMDWTAASKEREKEEQIKKRVAERAKRQVKRASEKKEEAKTEEKKPALKEEELSEKLDQIISDDELDL